MPTIAIISNVNTSRLLNECKNLKAKARLCTLPNHLYPSITIKTTDCIGVNATTPPNLQYKAVNNMKQVNMRGYTLEISATLSQDLSWRLLPSLLLVDDPMLKRLEQRSLL